MSDNPEFDAEQAAKDGFKDGDVVRWRVANKYTYAALYTAQKWWLTGTGAAYNGLTTMTHEGFATILDYNDVSDIVVVKEWEPVES